MTDPQAELDRARTDHAATMARLKGKSGREAEEEVNRSAKALRDAHRGWTTTAEEGT